jgi:hypothetical protein
MSSKKAWWNIFGGDTTAQRLREQREILTEQIKIKRLEKGKRLTESAYNVGQDFWLTNYSDMLDRYAGGFAGSYPITQPTDRRYGSNFPFWVSEVQLSMLRASARFIVTTSPNAQGLLNGLCSYVIGCGYSYRVQAKKMSGASDELVTAVQTVIDNFIEQNGWAEMEQEIFWRSREDGEAFIRLFPQPDGSLTIRTIEPEQIYQPGGSDIQEWSYGIKTDKDDVCTIKAYNVDYRASGGQEEATPTMGEEVSAENICHIKVNVKRSIKRGLTDFSFETLDAFSQAGKLRKNLGEGAAVQAAIAAVRQHDTSTVDQVQDFISDAVDYSTSSYPGRQQDFQKIEAGSFLDIPKGMTYVPPPAAANSAAHLEVFQGLLRSAGNRHNAPEWLVSSDASNGNYASSLTAEAPFTRHCVRLQEFYKGHFTRVIKAAIQTAIQAGLLPKNALNLVDLHVKAPSVETRDKAAEASANQIYSTLGVKSKQTIAQEIGLDWEDEEVNQHEAATSGSGGSTLKMPDEQDQQEPEEEAQPEGE